MSFEYKKANPNNIDFIALVIELNSSLSQITNDSGESSFTPEAFDLQKDGCLVVYLNDEAVGCGIFRYHSQETCELKRMYSKQPGAGSYLIKQLETHAANKGYRKAVLSTRRINDKAVSFYKRHLYIEIEPYGKYSSVNKSICMGKVLVT